MNFTLYGESRSLSEFARMNWGTLAMRRGTVLAERLLGSKSVRWSSGQRNL
jgi:hypothetical protein